MRWYKILTYTITDQKIRDPKPNPFKHFRFFLKCLNGFFEFFFVWNVWTENFWKIFLKCLNEIFFLFFWDLWSETRRHVIRTVIWYVKSVIRQRYVAMWDPTEMHCNCATRQARVRLRWDTLPPSLTPCGQDVIRCTAYYLATMWTRYDEWSRCDKVRYLLPYSCVDKIRWDTLLPTLFLSCQHEMRWPT